MRLMGDVNAVKKGRVAERIWNRAVYKTAGKVLRKVTK
jgi:hypothetical protein